MSAERFPSSTGSRSDRHGGPRRYTGGGTVDQVIIVFYPGLEFFVEMVEGKFYQGIFGGKQLGDDLSTLTVPLLQHL